MSENLPKSGDQDLYDLSITRVFDAPRAMVYEAFTNPEHVKRWMGPRGFVASHLEQDVRPRGRWRTCLHQVGEWDGRIYADLWQGGEFREVFPPERLIYTFAWEGQGQPTRETLITIHFIEIDANTTRIEFNQSFFDSIEQRDGHGRGWNSGFDRLNEFLATN